MSISETFTLFYSSFLRNEPTEDVLKQIPADQQHQKIFSILSAIASLDCASELKHASAALNDIDAASFVESSSKLIDEWAADQISVVSLVAQADESEYMMQGMLLSSPYLCFSCVAAFPTTTIDKEAIAFLSKAIDLNCHDGELYRRRASCNLGMGLLSNAFSDILRAGLLVHVCSLI